MYTHHVSFILIKLTKKSETEIERQGSRKLSSKQPSITVIEIDTCLDQSSDEWKHPVYDIASIHLRDMKHRRYNAPINFRLSNFLQVPGLLSSKNRSRSIIGPNSAINVLRPHPGSRPWLLMHFRPMQWRFGRGHQTAWVCTFHVPPSPFRSSGIMTLQLSPPHDFISRSLYCARKSVFIFGRTSFSCLHSSVFRLT